MGIEEFWPVCRDVLRRHIRDHHGDLRETLTDSSYIKVYEGTHHEVDLSAPDSQGLGPSRPHLGPEFRPVAPSTSQESDDFIDFDPLSDFPPLADRAFEETFAMTQPVTPAPNIDDFIDATVYSHNISLALQTAR